MVVELMWMDDYDSNEKLDLTEDQFRLLEWLYDNGWINEDNIAYRKTADIPPIKI